MSRFKFQISNFDKSESLTYSLTRIIRLCEENNIELIGIKFPLTKEYYNVLGDNSFNADSLFYLNNIKVIDFKNLFLQNDDFFYDQDHLNNIGSEKFINVLAK